MLTAKELRKKYIEFFKSKKHAEIPSASLVPENDPSVLFTTAGMHPLVPFLMGEKHPAGKRLVNFQKCVRTGDIDEVGDKTHHTFFEMLGHWSLGDYFKTEAIQMSYKFLTQELKLDKNRLAFTVFAGDDNAERDEEAALAWKNLGVSEKRIAYLPKKDNWWEPTGNSGPCGPCTEMFFWTDKSEKVPDVFDPADKRWVEIGNDVLMQYEKIGENKYKIANQKNIDNGTGLERLLAVINGLDDNYQTDLFWPIIEKIEELSGKKYDDSPEIKRAMRIIADHIRASVMLVSDGVVPSNLECGYVLRRLLRRAIRYGRMLGIIRNFTAELASVVIFMETYADYDLNKNRRNIKEEFEKEEAKFSITIEKGLEILEEMKPKRIANFGSKSFFSEYGLDGNVLFDLYSTYGFPIEMSLEEVKKLYKEYNIEQGVEITELSKEDENRIMGDFHGSLKKHQELSRTAAAGKFKGGLADHSEKVTQYHTATHLLLAALRKILGEDITQKGSNITDERMRFDFNWLEKVPGDKLKQVEDLVNQKITEKIPVEMQELPKEEAMKIVKKLSFDLSKYGDIVKVYRIGDFSAELCGGPHVKNTSELGHFRIIKEEASSAGVRRIKAILE